MSSRLENWLLEMSKDLRDFRDERERGRDCRWLPKRFSEDRCGNWQSRGRKGVRSVISLNSRFRVCVSGLEDKRN